MEIASLARVFFAFLFVIGLMLGIAWLAKRFKLDEKMQGIGGRKSSRGGLVVKDSLTLDTRRRLVVVGHEGDNYLLLLGPAGDLVLSSKVGDASHAA